MRSKWMTFISLFVMIVSTLLLPGIATAAPTTPMTRVFVQGRTNGRSQPAAADVVTLAGQAIIEIERTTLNGKDAPDLEELVNTLFVDAVWTLQPDSTFQFTAVNGDEPMVWEGQWEYDEQEQHAFLATEIFEATLFAEEDAWYLYVQMNTHVEEVGRIRAEFYQAVLFQENSASSPAQNITLTIKNSTRTKICYVYISPTGEETWGEDWLGNEEIIRPRQQRQFEVTADTYDLLAQDCDGEDVAELLEVELAEDSIWTIEN